MKIAAYTIALNEAKHAQRWAQSCRGADYLLVADTGSTDGTQEILRDHGVMVPAITVKPWRFDVARNAALALVPADADVCVSVDMDEVPEPGFFDKVRAGLGGAHGGMILMDTGPVWRSKRVHVRAGYRWVCPCHEIVAWYGPESERLARIEARIRHEPDNGKARTGYLDLLRLACREQPEDGRMWTYLAREHYFRRDWPAMVWTAHEALSRPGWPVERAALCRWAAASGKDRRAWLERGVREASDQLEAWHALALLEFEEGHWDKCMGAALQVESIARPDHYLVDPAVWAWGMWDLAAVAAWNLGRKDEARAYAAKALAGNPIDARLARNVEEMKT